MAQSEDVYHDVENERFTLKFDGVEDLAFLKYTSTQSVPLVWDFRHTYCPPSLRGRGVAAKLVEAGFDAARAAGAKVIPSCSYIPVWLAKHPAQGDIVAAPE